MAQEKYSLPHPKLVMHRFSTRWIPSTSFLATGQLAIERVLLVFVEKHDSITGEGEFCSVALRGLQPLTQMLGPRSGPPGHHEAVLGTALGGVVRFSPDNDPK